MERLHNLIKAKATGTPKSLANKLNLSERQIRRLIDYMRTDLAIPIEYRAEKESYCYTSEVHFAFNLTVDGRLLFYITGRDNVENDSLNK